MGNNEAGLLNIIIAVTIHVRQRSSVTEEDDAYIIEYYMREIVSEECYKVIRTLKYLFAKVIYDFLTNLLLLLLLLYL